MSEEVKEATEEDKRLNLHRLKMEFNALVLCSNYCFYCLKENNNQVNATIPAPQVVDNKQYENLIFPICGRCSGIVEEDCDENILKKVKIACETLSNESVWTI